MEPVVNANIVIAPIRKLPSDVLGYIFITGQRFIDSDGFIPVSNPKCFVRNVSQVSTQWRAVAHSSPSHWSRIEYERGRFDAQALFQQCISLSRATPLHPLFVTSAIAQSAGRLKELICKDTSAFSTAVAEIPPAESFYLLSHLHMENIIDLPLNINPSPALSNLTLRSVRYKQGGITFQAIPGLSSLTITSVWNIVEVLGDQFPWNQITDFDCVTCRFSEDNTINSILSKMTSLKTLRLDYRDHIKEKIALPNLNTLKIGLFRYGGWWREQPFEATDGDKMNLMRLHFFVAPNLSTLEIYFPVSPNTLLDLLNSSGCYIKYLTLLDTSLGTYMEHAQFRNLQGLYLRCKEQTIDTDCLWLTRDGKFDDVRLPALESLKLDLTDTQSDKTVSYIIDMIKSRLPASKPSSPDENSGVRSLKSVKIKIRKKLENTDLHAIRDFIKSDPVQQSGIEYSIKCVFSIMFVDVMKGTR